MGKREIPKDYIAVSDFAKTVYNRRGYPIGLSYLYRMIREGKMGKYGVEVVEVGQTIFVKKLKN